MIDFLNVISTVEIVVKGVAGVFLTLLMGGVGCLVLFDKDTE